MTNETRGFPPLDLETKEKVDKYYSLLSHEPNLIIKKMEKEIERVENIILELDISTVDQDYFKKLKRERNTYGLIKALGENYIKNG